ncbi:Tryptophan 2,3-dioxygenase [Streptomyces tendae]
MTHSTSTCPDLSTDDPLTQPFQGSSPYDSYVHASVLNSLQHPLTEAADEMGFLVTTQVMELWFTLIAHEWRVARESFVKDDLDAAMDALVRSRRALHALNASWAPISALTPVQFNGFRAAFGKASGFQSAMYRHLEFLLGQKSPALVRAHQGDPSVHEALREAYREPSLYDEVLLFLHRRGLPVPEHVREPGRHRVLRGRRGRGGGVAADLRGPAARSAAGSGRTAHRHRRTGHALAAGPCDGGAPRDGRQAGQRRFGGARVAGAARGPHGVPRAVGGAR